MNVRIENQNLRFKITEEELKMLLAEHCLHAKVGLLDKTLVVTINPQRRDEGMNPKLVLDDSEVYLNLLISSKDVQKLSDMGRSREGLKQKINGVSVTIQVDMPEACHT